MKHTVFPRVLALLLVCCLLSACAAESVLPGVREPSAEQSPSAAADEPWTLRSGRRS